MPPPGLARLLSGILRGSELELIAMLETRRHGRLVEGVEVTIDDVSVLEGCPWCVASPRSRRSS